MRLGLGACSAAEVPASLPDPRCCRSCSHAVQLDPTPLSPFGTTYSTEARACNGSGAGTLLAVW